MGNCRNVSCAVFLPGVNEINLPTSSSIHMRQPHPKHWGKLADPPEPSRDYDRGVGSDEKHIITDDGGDDNGHLENHEQQCE